MYLSMIFSSVAVKLRLPRIHCGTRITPNWPPAGSLLLFAKEKAAEFIPNRPFLCFVNRKTANVLKDIFGKFLISQNAEAVAAQGVQRLRQENRQTVTKLSHHLQSIS